MKKIKQILTCLLILIIGNFTLVTTIGAQTEPPNQNLSTTAPSPTPKSGKKVSAYLFYSHSCPHCADEEEFLEQILPEYQDRLVIYTFALEDSQENQTFYQQTTETLNQDSLGVPFLVIMDQVFIGYGGENTTGKAIKNRIDECLENNCQDSLHNLMPEGNVETLKPASNDPSPTPSNQEHKNTSKNTQKTKDLIIDVPFFGQTNLKSLSLPVATIVIAFMDGFNPCAMWILIFLISMLINMKNKKKLYLLGSAFIVTSAVVYYFFLAAWLNIFQIIGYSNIIKKVVGIIAIYSGYKHIKSSLKSDGTCEVVNPDQRKTIMDKIKDIIHEQSFVLALIGIIVLAVSVNMIELICSTGLPAIFTNLLSNLEIPNTHRYLYMLLYVIVFMIDDLFVFFVAIKSFELTGITSKYTKISGLIGGGLILIIGLLLIFKPAVLMFGM